MPMTRRQALWNTLTGLAAHSRAVGGGRTAVSVTGAAEVILRDGTAVLRSGPLERLIALDSDNVTTTSFSIGGRQLLAAPAREFSVTVTREASNRKPRGLAEAGEPKDSIKTYRAEGTWIDWRLTLADLLRDRDSRPNAPRWVDSRSVVAASWNAVVSKPSAQVTHPEAGVTRLRITAALDRDPVLTGLVVELNYELYDGYPAIRKWIAIRNGGSQWLKVAHMVIEDLELAPCIRKPLTPVLYGVEPSVVGFEDPGCGFGVLAASEIPSALRSISDEGAMGYTPELFEWVIGPGEEFVSEPVFYFGCSGPVQKTVSSVSTPVDRALEGSYMNFLNRHVGNAAESAPMHGPQWMTFAYFYRNIDDRLVRQLADIAARAGFTEMLLDAGWQKGTLGTDVNTVTFPDFAATSEFIRSRGMALGLWLSCFRDLDSRDLAAMPNARILPLMMRDSSRPGLAMSFASNWRDYYVKDLIAVARRYGVTYFKQDLSAIVFGDLAEGHESRTRKESLLRGLRGLLAAQQALRREAPDVVNELTHEIYWATPGAPADIAALKHAARFHIPPNACPGSDLRGRSITAEEHKQMLRQGCWLARLYFYAHRGLPLYALELYAATTANHLGSLTPDIQDRQVASWLMGAPVCFSGDLRTLTDDQIRHYRKRLDQVQRMEKLYGIYKRFQFSGVPTPTDVDWHWWGKLNDQGYGAVVVLRGSGGATRRAVNIPWVRHNASYRVLGVFSGKSYGTVPGRTLQDLGLQIELPVYGQELLELAPTSSAPK